MLHIETGVGVLHIESGLGLGSRQVELASKNKDMGALVLKTGSCYWSIVRALVGSTHFDSPPQLSSFLKLQGVHRTQ